MPTDARRSIELADRRHALSERVRTATPEQLDRIERALQEETKE